MYEETLLQRSPEVAPVLNRLHDQHKLYSLAKDKDAGARAELTDIMVDLLNFNLSERENELLTDVVISLIRQAEKDLKQALALRLSSMEDVPLRMILELANEDIDIADSVLRNSAVLQDMDLVYIIKSKGIDHWRAIASRAKMGPQVITALAETRDLETAITLSENENIILSNQAISIFVEMSKESDRLAKPLLMRDELPGIIGRVLYEFVGEEIKGIIRENFPVDIDMVSAVDDLVLEFVEPKEDVDMDPSPKAKEMARHLSESGSIRIDTLLNALKSGMVQSFVAMFSEFTHLPIITVKEIMRQENGQGLAIACRAGDIPKGDFISIFLLSKKIRLGEGTVVNNKELLQASNYYDKISKEMALEIMSKSRH
jgi:uncharacterized protein (DUF2336 family)